MKELKEEKQIELIHLDWKLELQCIIFLPQILLIEIVDGKYFFY